MTLADTSDLTVIGYGLVRAVDTQNKCLYITTPESAGRLASVNVLYKLNGNITPENWIYNQIGKVSVLSTNRFE